MRWSPLLSVVIGLSIAGGRLLSQETAEDHRPTAPDAGPPSLLQTSSAAHFQLVLGRLQLDPVRYRKGVHSRQLSLPKEQGVLTESLSVDAHRGIPTLRYCRQSLGRQLTLDVNERGKLQLESIGASDGSRVVITQELGRPISIRRFHGDHSEEHQVATWIHLYVAVEAIYSDHFESLIDDLLSPARLGELAQRAHARSIAEMRRIDSLASDGSPPGVPGRSRIDNQTLGQWVDSLGSTHRVERIAAQRRLHEQGISLLPRLHQIDRRSLDAEQSERLSQLIRQLTPRSDDHEARVASLIRDDSTYWAAAAERLSSEERSLIALRFEHLDGRTSERIATVPPIADSGRR